MGDFEGKVLLVNPFFLHESALEQVFMTPYPPLGLLSVAAAVRDAGFSVAVFDGTFEAGDAAFRQALARYRPDVACIASLITLRPTALRLSRIAARAGARVIVGGPDPTAEPEQYVSEPAIDIVIRGEGEQTLVALLELFRNHAPDAPVADVPGIAFQRADGSVVKTAQADRSLDLEDLPWPARDLVDIERYMAAWRGSHGYSSLNLVASRGCPYGCEHCSSAGPGAQLHFRLRSSESVAAEMRQLEAEYQPDRFRLVDDLEGLGRDWLVALGEAMAAAGVTTPYEGLRPLDDTDLPMLAQAKDLCAERNAWIPPRATHPHASPDLDAATLDRRWRDARLLEGEHLEDP